MKLNHYFTLLMVPVIAAGMLIGCTQPAKKEARKDLVKTEKDVRNEVNKSANKVQKNAQAVDNRTLKQVAAEDKYPQGCASCHKVENGKDRTLNAEVKKLEEHPSVPAKATIKDCLNCHRRDKERLTKLQNGLHKAHAESKVFHPKLEGTCVSCHNIDNKGYIGVKGEK